MAEPQQAGATATSVEPPIGRASHPEGAAAPATQALLPPTPPLTLAETRQALKPGEESSVYVFRPELSENITDPFYIAVNNFQWADRQQHGRMFYNKMMQHMAVSGPMNTLITLLKAFRPNFKPSVADPSDEQKQYARFLNEQMRRMGIDGDPRQGYEKFIEHIGVGLRYGFSIAEMGTIMAAWEGQSRVQLERIVPIPQATLDSGWNPAEEYGYIWLPSTDVRYDCFALDEHGRIEAVRQFHNRTEKTIEWRGAELLHLLIFTHGGGEGNPYGESLLFPAAGHFADLYTTERMDIAMLDGGQPFLGISYKTPDGRPSPAMHQQVIEILKQQDKDVRAFILPDATYTSVSSSNPAYNTQSEQKKKETRSYIHQAIFGANIAGDAASATEIDTRNVLQVFFKYLMPGGLLREVGTLLQWQFGKRLLDANWSNLTAEDYPTVEFQNMLDNDLRVAMPLLQQVMPYIDSARLGEFLEKNVPGFDRSWIPENHENSVAKKREMPDPAAQPKGGGQPTKPQGTPDVNKGTNAEGIGKDVATDA